MQIEDRAVVRKRVKDWYNNNADRKQAYGREWLELNREYKRGYWAEYRAAKRIRTKGQCTMAGCSNQIGYGRRNFCDPCGRQNEQDH